MFIDAIEAQMIQFYQPNFKGFKRNYYLTSLQTLDALKSSVIDATEPYFLMNSIYLKQSITNVFDISCATFGADSIFYTKNSENANHNQPVLSNGAYAGIVIGGVALILGVILLSYMIIKERNGNPIFMPLKNYDENENQNNNNNNSDIMMNNYQNPTKNQNENENKNNNIIDKNHNISTML